MIVEDRVPIPVGQSAKGTVEHLPPAARRPAPSPSPPTWPSSPASCPNCPSHSTSSRPGSGNAARPPSRPSRRRPSSSTPPTCSPGLGQHGYRSVCVGGVTYFSRETPLGSVLPDLFDEDHWRPEFCSPEPNSTRHQVDHALEIAEQYEDRPIYLFVNVSATHVPHGHYLGDSRDTLASQQAALAYADAHLARLITTLTAEHRWLIILCADHGDAFGEDGHHGRGIAHPVVMNVLYAAILR